MGAGPTRRSKITERSFTMQLPDGARVDPIFCGGGDFPAVGDHITWNGQSFRVWHRVFEVEQLDLDEGAVFQRLHLRCHLELEPV